MNRPGDGQEPKIVKDPVQQARNLANTVAKRRQYFMDRGSGVKWSAVRSSIHKSNNAFVEVFALLDALHIHVLGDPIVRFKTWRRILGNKQKYEIVDLDVKSFARNLRRHMRRFGMGQEVEAARSAAQAHKQSLTRSRKPTGQVRRIIDEGRTRGTTNNTFENSDRKSPEARSTPMISLAREQVLPEINAHSQADQAISTQGSPIEASYIRDQPAGPQMWPEQYHSFIMDANLEQLVTPFRQLNATISAMFERPVEDSATQSDHQTAANREAHTHCKVKISCRRM